MRIGIDIDGVLTDYERWQIEYGSRYFNKKPVNKNAYEVFEIFDVSQKAEYEFWSKYLYEYATDEKAREYSSEIINKLKEEKNEIYIITARCFTTHDNENGAKMRKIVIDWLSKNKIIYDKILFTPEDKLDTCLENKIEVMIEDKYENVCNISTKIPVICFNANYNKDCIGKNIHRVYNWNEIYLLINKFKNKEY